MALLAAAWLCSGFVAPEPDGPGQSFVWQLDDPPAFVPQTSFNRSTKAIRYYLGREGSGVGDTEAELNAIRASFGQWQSVPGTRLRFEEAGFLGPNPVADVHDGTNAVFWCTQQRLAVGDACDIGGALGLTFRGFINDVPTGADIVLSGRIDWFTDFDDADNADWFVEGVMVHEIGHLIGLDHSPVGGATLLARGATGIGTQVGLSRDDWIAAQALYPEPGLLDDRGTVEGVVTMDGNPVFGAMVTLDDAAGNIMQGTVSREDGGYRFPALPAGRYQLRVSPLDPSSAVVGLVRGADIDASGRFFSVETRFLPTEDLRVEVAARQNLRRDVAVSSGEPFVRLTHVRPPSASGSFIRLTSAGAMIERGLERASVGVYAPTLPDTGASLRVTGDGISHGPTSYLPAVFNIGGREFDLVSVEVSIAADATPGLRSFVLRQGTDVVYANGFLEVLPGVRDDDFDGMDDRFERRFFPVFTRADALGDADPDGDGVTNLEESFSGTDPTDATDLFRVETVRLTDAGAEVVWNSVPERNYRVWSRADFSGAAWRVIVPNVASGGRTTRIVDGSAAGELAYYRIEVLP